MELLMGTGKQRAGKESRISVTGKFLTWASWEVAMSGPDLPTTNFESYDLATLESYDEGLHGPIGAELSGGGDWDAGTAPLGDPPGLYIRDDLAGVQMIPSRLDDVPWHFDFVRVRSATVGTEVTGKVSFRFGGRNQGRFTWPQVSV